MCEKCTTQSRQYDWRGCFGCAVRAVKATKKTHDRRMMLEFVGQWHDTGKVLSRVAGEK